MIRLGIDVGMHNVHAALVDGQSVLAAAQVEAHDDRMRAIATAITDVLRAAGSVPAEIGAIVVGTAIASNALADTPDLGRVAVVRIGGPSTAAIRPMAGWPNRVAELIDAGSVLIDGGFDLSARPIAPLDERALIDFFSGLANPIGALAERVGVAISSTFSEMSPAHELRARELGRQRLGPATRIVTSHEIGGVGLIDRENATVLNAALMDAMDAFLMSIRLLLEELDLGHAVLACSHNDGSAMVAEYAQGLPVFTVASATATVARGASVLSGHSDGVMVHTSDNEVEVCTITGGSAAETMLEASISGVRVRHRSAHAMRLARPGADGAPVDFSLRLRAALQEALSQVPRFETAFQKDQPVALVSVGEAHAQFERLLGSLIPGMPTPQHPQFAESATAIGAACAPVHGTAEAIVELGREDSTKLHAQLELRARRQAIRAGADPSSVRMLEAVETPLSYFSEPMARFSVRAVGTLIEAAPA